MYHSDEGSWANRAQLVQTALIAILVVGSILPVWLYPYPPLQDYPGHLLEAHIAQQYHNPTFNYSANYTLIDGPVPYAASTFVIRIFALSVPIEVAGKLFLSLYIILYPLSIIYLLRSTQGHATAIELAPIVYLMNWFFFKGMINYLYGLFVLFFALGFFLRNPALSRFVTLALAILSVVAFYFHLGPYAILALSLISISLLASWRREKPYTHLARIALLLAPSLILLVGYFILVPRSSMTSPVWGLKNKIISLAVPFMPLFRNDPFGSNLPLTAINVFVPLLLTGFILLTLDIRPRVRSGPVSGNRWLSPFKSLGGVLIRPELAMTALLILVLAFVSPTSAGSLSWIDQRFIYPSLVLLAASLRWKEYHRVSEIGIGVLAVLVLGLQWANWAWASPQLKNVDRLTSASPAPLSILYTTEVCDLTAHNRLSAGILSAYRVPFYRDIRVGNFNESIFDVGLLRVKPLAPADERGTSYHQIDPTKALDRRLVDGFNSVLILTCNDRTARLLMDQLETHYQLVGQAEDAYLLLRRA